MRGGVSTTLPMSQTTKLSMAQIQSFSFRRWCTATLSIPSGKQHHRKTKYGRQTGGTVPYPVISPKGECGQILPINVVTVL